MQGLKRVRVVGQWVTEKGMSWLKTGLGHSQKEGTWLTLCSSLSLFFSIYYGNGPCTLKYLSKGTITLHPPLPNPPSITQTLSIFHHPRAIHIITLLYIINSFLSNKMHFSITSKKMSLPNTFLKNYIQYTTLF